MEVCLQEKRMLSTRTTQKTEGVSPLVRAFVGYALW